MGDHVKLVGITQMIEAMVGNENVYPFDGNYRFAPTGERYITFTSSGIRPEGAKEEFVDGHLFRNSFLRLVGLYMKSKGPGCILFWRRKPYLYEDKDTGKSSIHARLLVSSMPVVISHDRDLVSDEEFERYKKESMKP